MIELKKSQDEMSNMLLQTVISICVSDVGGIKLLPPRPLGKFYSILRRDLLNSVMIHYDNQHNITIEMFIEVEYNQFILWKVKELQELIKKEIEVITGYRVHSVNVYVDALRMKSK